MTDPTTVRFIRTNRGPVVLFRYKDAVRALCPDPWNRIKGITSLFAVTSLTHQLVTPHGWQERFSLEYLRSVADSGTFAAEVVYDMREVTSDGPTWLALRRVVNEGFRVFGYDSQKPWMAFWDRHLMTWGHVSLNSLSFRAGVNGAADAVVYGRDGLVEIFYTYNRLFDCSTGRLVETVEVP